MKSLTVGELKKALEGVPDHLAVKLSSDTGVDQGMGSIIILHAEHINYECDDGCIIDYFDIYANDIDMDAEEEEAEIIYNK